MDARIYFMKKGGRIESFLELVQSEDDGESSFEEENDTDCGDEDETKREASRSNNNMATYPSFKYG